jgi:membrane protein DedA with SNARE-associated domain
MWLLFTWVLANQAGVPISVVPSLIGAGVLASAGHMSLVTTVVVTVTASIIADLAWYSIGRWCGAHAAALLEKFSRHAAARVKVAKRRFAAHQLGFLFASRFLPEVNPLAAGMAGAARISPGRYIAIVTVSALVWAATWTGAGYALGNVATGLSTSFGVVTGIIVLAAAIAAIATVVLKHRRAARASVSTGP